MYLNSTMLSLFPSGSGDSASLLSLLGGGGGVASAINPVTALQSALTNETKGVAAAAGDPQTKREIANFRAAVAKATSPQQLLADPDARKVLLTANGLGDQADYTALATKVLTSDTSKTDSLASKMTNTQWLSTAKTYDFANKGLSVLSNPAVLDSIAGAYAEVKWRQGLDQSTPGLSNALDFRSRATSITSVDQILGDTTLREVVTVALGIPKQIAFQSLQAQENAISSRVDVTKFKDPAFVEQFTKRYLIAAQPDPGTTGAAGSLSSLFA